MRGRYICAHYTGCDNLEDIRKLEQDGTMKVLYRFYHTRWMFRKRWDSNKAQQQAMDLAISAILEQAAIDFGNL